MPIRDGKYVTPAWQNGGAPAITAEELTAIGQSIEQDQTNITENTQNIESNTESINTLDQWKTNRDPLIQGALQKSGGTMTGNLILNANPTQNMQAATKQYVDNGVKITTGSYVGTGTYGSDNPNTLTFPFEPKILFIYGGMRGRTSGTRMGTLVMVDAPNYGYAMESDTYTTGTIVNWGTSISWYGNSELAQLNRSDYTYYYVAIG